MIRWTGQAAPAILARRAGVASGRGSPNLFYAQLLFGRNRGGDRPARRTRQTDETLQERCGNAAFRRVNAVLMRERDVSKIEFRKNTLIKTM